MWLQINRVLNFNSSRYLHSCIFPLIVNLLSLRPTVLFVTFVSPFHVSSTLNTIFCRWISTSREISATVLKPMVKAAVPLQAWSGPEGSRKLRFPDFMTTAQDGCKVSLTQRSPLPPRKHTWYSFLLEAESTPGP
jgi:hypothetical protein